ncbi:hypothetical protein DM02DRAFT_527035 [Periconia macrospinosa]|uniref:Zn(2)-C6 fungal-type domain-containing protein n=1 Tax=Periconia macrospinosa TaxID=97972 RepID=A0A2V1DR19_9PLEO|nr:hypothetical protein DM02DRAFT_527035 [Periconia macrospinosa]
MLTDIHRLPSMHSHSPSLHAYAPHGQYPRTSAPPSQPDGLLSSQHPRPQEPEANQTHKQQLPSLRTLLRPQLLDTQVAELPVRPNAAFPNHGPSTRYESTSPALKRRHDFDGHSPDNSENNAIASRPPPIFRHSLYTPAIDTPLAKPVPPGSVPGPHPSDFSRHATVARFTHNEPVGSHFRPSSTNAALNAPADSAVALSTQSPQDDAMDVMKPIKKRAEGVSRAPVRSSRCVGQREVPGEGLCYVYEDGSYCRAIIDGEPVNPSWGITKAGKPRKRLAQACLTCREKKIKCEPAYPKCQQCTKSQRACRGGLNHQGMSNASEETSPSSSAVLFKTRSTELNSPVAGPNKLKALDEQRDYTRTSENWNVTSFKSQAFRPNSVATLRDMSVHSMDSDWSGSGNYQDPDGHRRGSHQDHLALQWEQDPYEADPTLTMRLLDLYFNHAGRATYGMFPRKPFTSWIETNREKNQDYLMLVYSVLAMGSVFSADLEDHNIGRRFAAIASYATEKRFGRFTLQLCQSRLMLALYNFARGKSHEAWDLCGAGLRAISALRLNTEEGITELPDSLADLDYGFDRPTLEECCRRTFWSGFLMDVSSIAFTTTTTPDLIFQQRYNGFCGGTLCVINIEDTFLRLPCLETMFEASTPCDTPFFDFELLSRHSPPGPPLGYMAYLSLISMIWGDVLTFTSRAIRRPESGYERIYEEFYAQTYERLDKWHAMLPENLRYSRQNLDNSIVEGFAGTFVSLHALYATAIIRLNRHVRVHMLGNEKLARNIDQAFRTASHFHSMMHSLAATNRVQRLPPNTATNFLFSTPFPGYALMLSIDVLTAVGTIATLPSLIETLETSMTCIEELANFWASARAQHKAISNRIKQLADVVLSEEQGARNGSYGPFWKLKDGLETAFGNEDLLYKVNEQVLFNVIEPLTAQ